MLVDPRHLVQLYTIVEVGSFVAAAERLGLTQPGLSRNIRILEARIGVKLLNRGKHGATPTDEGKVLAAYGRTLRELTQQAATIGTSVQRGEIGELRVGASFTIANGLIAEPVSRFPSTAGQKPRFASFPDRHRNCSRSWTPASSISWSAAFSSSPSNTAFASSRWSRTNWSSSAGAIIPSAASIRYRWLLSWKHAGSSARSTIRCAPTSRGE